MERTILITNDDGFQAPGISALVEVAKEFGKVIVVAPEKSWSAKSHGVTTEIPVFVRKTDYFGDIEAYVTTGMPVDCVKLGIENLASTSIDLVLSGINHGDNASINVFYSGTVAAAIEGALNGIDSIAISVSSFDRNADLTLAKKYTRKIIELVLKNKINSTWCLNLNIPDIDQSEAKGIKFCRAAKGVWKKDFVQRQHPSINQKYYWLTGNFFNFEPDNEQTDLWALANGYAAAVPINLDFTNYEILQKIKNLGV